MKYNLYIIAHAQSMDDDEPAKIVGRLTKEGTVCHKIDFTVPTEHTDKVNDLIGELHKGRPFHIARRVVALLEVANDALKEWDVDIGTINMAETVVYVRGAVVQMIDADTKTRASITVSSSVTNVDQPVRLEFQ